MSSSSSVASLGGGSGWGEQLLNAKITCLNQDGRIKAHFQLDQNTEMAEEYDTRNGQLLLRKWRRKSTLGGAPKAWDYEIGEDALKSVSSSELPGGNTLDLYESNSNPICVARNTKDNFEWRIRNLPYPLEVYDVNVNTEENRIVVRTSNKKYFKKLPIPSMDRIGVKLVQSNVRFAHSNNTLVVHYRKPVEVIELEKRVFAKLKSLPAAGDAGAAGGMGASPGECAQQ